MIDSIPNTIPMASTSNVGGAGGYNVVTAIPDVIVFKQLRAERLYKFSKDNDILGTTVWTKTIGSVPIAYLAEKTAFLTKDTKDLEPEFGRILQKRFKSLLWK